MAGTPARTSFTGCSLLCGHGAPARPPPFPGDSAPLWTPPSRRGSQGITESGRSAAGRYPPDDYPRLVARSLCVTWRRGRSSCRHHAAPAPRERATRSPEGSAPQPYSRRGPEQPARRGWSRPARALRRPRALRRRRSDLWVLPTATLADARDFAETSVRAGHQCRPHPRFLTEKREKPPRTGEACPQGLTQMWGRRARGGAGKRREVAGLGRLCVDAGAPRTGEEAEGLPVQSTGCGLATGVR